MDPFECRFECIKLAVGLYGNDGPDCVAQIVEAADEFYQYIMDNKIADPTKLKAA